MLIDNSRGEWFTTTSSLIKNFIYDTDEAEMRKGEKVSEFIIYVYITVYKFQAIAFIKHIVATCVLCLWHFFSLSFFSLQAVTQTITRTCVVDILSPLIVLLFS